MASGQPSRYTQVTYFPGVETSPSLSPDGKSIAFVSWKEGKEDIYIQRIDGRNAINLTRDLPGDHAQPAFSPDGSFLAFASSRDGGGIFVMGATGESVRRLTSMGADPSWSPDGKTNVFCTERFFSPYARETVSSLHSVEVASGRTTLLLKQDGVQPRFSPSGKRIAYWGLPAGSGDREIWTLPAAADPDGGGAVRVTTDDHLDWNPFWSADGKWLYFASDRHGSMNLWRIAIDEESGRTSGDPQRVMLPASWAGYFSPLPDATKVAFVNVAQSSRIEQWSIEDPKRPPRVIFEGALLATGVAVSPDGRSLAFSAASPQEDIYIIGVDGTGLRQLTNDPEKDRGPRWSPDGSEIAFYSSRAGRYEIWSVRVDGSNLRALTRTTGDTVTWPHWSSDRKKILADQTGPWVFDVTTAPASGSAVSIRDLEPGTHFRIQDWSAGGRLIAGEIWRESLGSPGVVLLDLQTGTLDRLTNFGGSPRFLPDGRNIVMAGDETMLMLDRASRKTRPLFPAMPSTFWWPGGTPQLQFGNSQYYDLSRDGKHAYLIRNDTESDIWVAELK